MDFAFPEKLAYRGTGRLPVETSDKIQRRLIVYPADLQFRRLLFNRKNSDSPGTYFLEYPDGNQAGILSFAALFGFIISFLKVLPLCRHLDLYIFSSRNNWLYILSLAIAARVLGVALNLYDYRFLSKEEHKITRVLYSICRRLELGDVSAVSEHASAFPVTAFRAETAEASAYREFVKDRAVPRVIVYGNYEDTRTISLIRRTHDLIKQKYPRTEFLLPTMTSSNEDCIRQSDFARSIEAVPIGSEENLKALFSDADIVMLLSPGGLNRCFSVRARAAGFPIIANGIAYPYAGKELITVARDSYGGLAESVIRLVDSDAYYGSFLDI